MTIAERLFEIYDEITIESPCKLRGQEGIDYFERQFMNGNVITYIQDGELLGFLEFWKISYEQWGRICCYITLAHNEDLLSGNICLIANMWIKPDLRNWDTFLLLGRTFLEKNKDATHFAAQQFRKAHKPFQIYTREEVLKHYKIS